MFFYKKIFRSRRLRLFILDKLSWIPDIPMVWMQYLIHQGRVPNLKNPTRLTEKILLYKTKYRNPLMKRCVDKVEVRNYLKEIGHDDLLVPLVGIYSSPQEIDFEQLPNEFVAKTSDGGGGAQVMLCNDKRKLDKGQFFNTLESWMSLPKSQNSGREWAYDNPYPRKIIIEHLLKEDGLDCICDYKFHCFNGKAGFLYGIDGRNPGHGARFGIYDTNFNKLDVWRTDEFKQPVPLKKPLHFDKLLSVAEELSKPFPYVRMDLYYVDNEVYFSEFTFYDSAGYITFNPDSFDEEAGKLFDASFML